MVIVHLQRGAMAVPVSSPLTELCILLERAAEPADGPSRTRAAATAFLRRVSPALARDARAFARCGGWSAISDLVDVAPGARIDDELAHVAAQAPAEVEEALLPARFSHDGLGAVIAGDAGGWRDEGVRLLRSLAVPFAGFWQRLEPRLARSTDDAVTALHEGVLGDHLVERTPHAQRGDDDTVEIGLGPALWEVVAARDRPLRVGATWFGSPLCWSMPGMRPVLTVPMLGSTKIAPPDEERASALAVLAVPTRLRITTLLATGARSSGEIANDLGIARSTASEHLGLLQGVGLIRRRPGGADARVVVWELDEAGYGALVEWLGAPLERARRRRD